MKGLLIKDLFLMKNQMRSAGLIALIGIMLAFTNPNPEFLISYIIFIFAIFSMSTISYDEMDNGMSFLFTLPLSRRKYVLSKYVLGISVTCIAALFSQLIILIPAFVNSSGTALSETLAVGFIVLCCAIILLGFEIPVQFKFGMEKSRIIIFGSFAFIVAAGTVLGKSAGNSGFSIEEVNIPEISFANVVCLLCIFTAAVYFISYKISVKIICRRQF